jgi:enolase
MKVLSVKAREILDSKATPTIETQLILEDGSIGLGAVPSGASTGTTEALELRDGDPDRYMGKGVLQAVENVNVKIAKAIEGEDFQTQEDFDKFLIELDGTENKSKLGGNSILSCSMAFSKAMAFSQDIPLYKYFQNLSGYDNLEVPQLNVLIVEGGKHGNWATDFQEYMVVLKKEKFPTIAESVRAGAEIFKATHDVLDDKGYSTAVGFEGAYAPVQIKSNTEAFDIMLAGIEKAGYKPEEEVTLAIDAAASEFYDDGKYNLKREDVSLTSDEWIDMQIEWYKKYPVFSLEDTMDEEDWEGWSKLMDKVGDKYQIVGDDLLTTNTKRIQRSIDEKAANAVLIKINQIGTITETLDAIHLSDSAGFNTMISHRGGETNDDLIADLVIGTSSWQTKFGGPDRGERVAKYNRLMQIENEADLE